MGGVREGVGKRAERGESAAEISAVGGGTAGRLIANRAIASVVDFGNSGGNDDYWNEIRLVRCALHCVAPLGPRGRLVQIVRLPLGRQGVGQLLLALHWLEFEAQQGRIRRG